MAAKTRRRTNGRHRKNSQLEVRAHWLQVGAVTVGLTAAVAAGPAVAAAAPDDGTSTASSTDSADAAGPGSTGKSTPPPNRTRKQPSRAERATTGEADDSDSTTSRPREHTLDDSDEDTPATADERTGANRHQTRRHARDAVTPSRDDRPAVAESHPVAAQSATASASTPADQAPVISEQPPRQQISMSPVAVPVPAPRPEAPSQPQTATTMIATPASAPLDSGLPGDAPLAGSALLVVAAGVRRELDQVEAADAARTPVAGIVAAGAAPNRAPTAKLAYVAPAWFSGNVYGDVQAADPDWDRLSYSATSPTRGTVKVNGFGNFTYTPTAAARHAAAAANATPADRVDSFAITVSDGRGGTATVTVTVPIKPANNNPTARLAAVSNPVEATGVVTGTVTATDRDGDPVAFTGPTSTAKGTVAVAADGTFTYTPTAAARQAAKSIFARSDRFTVTVTDGHGGTDTVTVAVKITPPPANTAPSNPVVTKNPATADGTITGTVSATDTDPLTYSGPSSTSKGSVVVHTDGTFSYTPTPLARHNAAATNAATTGADKDTFTVTVSDGRGGTLGVTVNVDVSPHNDNPEITNATANTPGTDGTVTGTITATDADHDTLTFGGTGSTAKGSVVVNPGGTFTYTPTQQARDTAATTPGADTDTFTATVTDGHGGTDSQEITVTVAPTDTGHATTVATTDGFPIGGVFVGRTGYGYQLVGHPNSTPGHSSTTILVVGPDGNSVVTQSIPGLPGSVASGTELGDFDYTPVGRPDGSMVYFSYDGFGPTGTTRVVQVSTDGTVTYLHTGAGAGLPTHTADGTLYQLTVVPKTIVVNGQSAQVTTFEVWRVTADGQFSTHTYDLGDQQFASVSGVPTAAGKLGPDGTLYVPFTIHTVGSDDAGAVMVVKETGAATVYNGMTVLAVSPGGTAYLAGQLESGFRIAVLGTAGSVTNVDFAGGGLIGGVAGNHAVVRWSDGGADKVSVIDSTGSATTYSLSFDDLFATPDGSEYGLTPDGVVYFDASGVPHTIALSSPGRLMGVAPDGTVYLNIDNESSASGLSIVTLKSGVATIHPLEHGFTDLLQIVFAADGTAFMTLQAGGGDGALGVLDTDTISTPVTDPSDGSFSFQLTAAGNVGYLVTTTSTGTQVRAMSSDGTEVIAQEIPSSADAVAAAVAVGPDGSLYLALAETVQNGSTPAPVTHIWAVTGGSATEILTNDGAPLALTVSPGGDLWATLYDSVNGNVVTRLIAQSLGGVTSL